MNAKFRIIVAICMAFAVGTVYSFSVPELSIYAAEETAEVQAAPDAADPSPEEAAADSGQEDGSPDGAGGTDGEAADEADAGESEDAADEADAEDAADGGVQLMGMEDANEEEDIDMTEAAATGDFLVLGDEGSYSFDEENGVLYITGDVTVSTEAQTTQSIIVRGDCKVTLNGIDIKAAKGPAILIESPYNVELALAKDSVNKVTGANGVNINHVAGGYAGIEVEFEYESGDSPSNKMASLTISGSTGSLEATGATNAAGIGGSNSANGSKGKGLYGNITINGGTVKASSPNAGAGIGSSDNPGDGTSSGSYKKTGSNTWGTITINGGTVNAVSGNSGAGIGGGNHVDSGEIIINGGNVTAHGAAGIGCGIGSSKNNGNGGDKGPGYYAADVTINGGTVTATSNDIGAAIGGGMYCDAVITITGGTINATGGSRQGNTHHGGAGIGGGYLGHADITITGGDITAVGGDGAAGIGSGGSPNSKTSRGTNGRGTGGITTVEYTVIDISGGTIDAQGGPQGGAGIGLGVGADKGEITITGGDIIAKGAKSERYGEDVTKMAGGAGIGSGYYGLGSGSEKYFVEADIEISITGGDVVAVGGWGAAGIGSGAQNKTAETITIDADNAHIEAYADGTKFAIDTRDVQGDHTESITDGRTINGNILQGTFVHDYTSEDGVDQGTEGIKEIQVINDADDSDKVVLTGMKDYDLDGYRSFATNVSAPGEYNVYTEVPEIAEGEGRYFNKCLDDVRTPEDVDTEQDIVERGVKYTVTGNSLSDNFYLFPVKAVIVTKTIVVDEALLDGMTGDVYFSLQRYTRDDQGNKITADDFEKRKNAQGDETQWIESIHIEKGVPQSRAEFICVDEAFYDVWEVNEDGTPIDVTTQEVRLGDAKLVRIETKHGEGSDNNAQISKDNWIDRVEVINTYEGEKKELLIRKVLSEYVDHGTDGLDNVNATFVFRITGEYEKDGETKAYDNVVSMDFAKSGESVQEVRVTGIPANIEGLSVEETYAGNYKQDPDADAPEITESEDGVYEITFTNVKSDIDYKGGITNRYEITDNVSKYLNPLSDLADSPR